MENLDRQSSKSESWLSSLATERRMTSESEPSPLLMEHLEIWTYHFVPVLAWGKRFYGTVDRVPGMFYVATLFLHIFWIPLLPVGTWVCALESSEHTFGRSKRIRLSVRSLLMAWTRFFLIAVAVVCGIAGTGGLIAMWTEWRWIELPVWLLAALVAALIGLWCLRLFEPASFHRAKALTIAIGISEEAAERLLHQAEDERLNPPDPEDRLVACPNCGRKIAPTTVRCPRCEWRNA